MEGTFLDSSRIRKSRAGSPKQLRRWSNFGKRTLRGRADRAEEEWRSLDESRAIPVVASTIFAFGSLRNLCLSFLLLDGETTRTTGVLLDGNSSEVLRCYQSFIRFEKKSHASPRRRSTRRPIEMSSARCFRYVFGYLACDTCVCVCARAREREWRVLET